MTRILVGILLMAGLSCSADSSTTMASAARKFAQGEWAAARTLFEEVVAGEPAIAEAWVGIGITSAKLGDQPYSIRALKIAEGLYESRYNETADPHALLNQAFAVGLSGDIERAEGLLQLGRERHPEYEGFSVLANELKPAGDWPEGNLLESAD